MAGGTQLEQVVSQRVLAVFQQLNADPSRLIDLLEHGFGQDRTEDIDISKFQRYWSQGKNLWRMKIWSLESSGMAYRIIYAYSPITNRFHVLAIAHRSFNYDPSDPVTIRILDDYESLA